MARWVRLDGGAEETAETGCRADRKCSQTGGQAGSVRNQGDPKAAGKHVPLCESTRTHVCSVFSFP